MLLLDLPRFNLNSSVREAPDKHKPYCFELFSGDNEVIKACKTDSEGKVVEGMTLSLTEKKLLKKDYSHHLFKANILFIRCHQLQKKKEMIG